MEKTTRTRVMSGITALAMAFTMASMGEVKAEGLPTYKPGTFITGTESYGDPTDEENYDYEESQYGKYVVKKGDNTSKISEKICRYYDVDVTTKYWPVIAFLNGFPRVLKEGDVVIFPGEFEDMENLLISLKENGWTARYIQKHDIYGSRKNQEGTLTLGELLKDIYGDSVCVDEDFARKYLRVIGLRGYNLDSIVNGNTDTYFRFTEWIPTLNELEIEPNQKVKRKNR